MILSEISHFQDQLPSNYHLRSDGLINVTGSVYIQENTPIKYKYASVTMHFICDHTKRSLIEIGTPQVVGGDFQCMDSMITTLRGCPKLVGRHFTIVGSEISDISDVLETAIAGDFGCHDCPLSPQSIMNLFHINARDITFRDDVDILLKQFRKTNDLLGYQDALLDAGVI